MKLKDKNQYSITILVDIDIFNCSVAVVCGPLDKISTQVRKAFRGWPVKSIDEMIRRIERLDDGVDGSCFCFDGGKRLGLYMREWNVGVFVHEAYHIVHKVLDDHEIRDEETGAYLIEYLVNKVCKENN